MREIKFRAWDKEEKDWCFFDDPDTGERSTSGTIRSIAEQYFVGVIDDDSEYNSNIIWLEFTGLKDKNGKEIYEGDIVRFDTEDGIKTARIDFKEADGDSAWLSGFELILIDIGNCLNDYDNDYDIEVIGNIYESPELLKDL